MKKETKTFTMRIDVKLFEKLEKEALRRKRSINFVVNEKIEKSYREQKDKKKK